MSSNKSLLESIDDFPNPAASSSQLPPIEPSARKRRRKKKRPTESTSQIGTRAIPTISAGPVEISDPPLAPPPSTPQNLPTPEVEQVFNSQPSLEETTPNLVSNVPEIPIVDLEDRLRQIALKEQAQNQNTNFFVPVKDPQSQRIPQTVKEIALTNQMVQPGQDGKLYVQTKNGFQQRKIDDTSKPKKTDSESFPAPVRPEILHKQGEGFLAGIRSLSRFCLGISTGIAFVISLGVQMNVHFAPEIQEALQVTVSVLIITTCFGTLCNVDPVGHGGLARFFKMDPAGLANICVILSVLLSAVADCIYGAHKFENQNATEPVEDSSAYMIVGWVRTALLVIAWGAMSFSDPPGGALYQRIKKQNILSE